MEVEEQKEIKPLDITDTKSKFKQFTNGTVLPDVKDFQPYLGKLLILNIDEETNNGLKREIENKYNLRCGTTFFVDVSNGNNICGVATEQMIEKWANGEHMPEPPKPKSPAPPLHTDFDDDKQIKNFSKEYDKWALENKHLPNLQTSTNIIERFNKHL